MLFEFIEAWQPAQKHQKEGGGKNRRCDLRLGASIPDQPPLPLQAEDLFAVGEQAL
jgi:hypothetical protein